jgi:glutaredoxin-related protein
MARLILDESKLHPSIRQVVNGNHRDIVEEVMKAVEENTVVVVGMGQNPYCKKARQALNSRGIVFRYMEYGNYLTAWRRRNALKMWTGWPTFPMVFIRGVLIGGNSDLNALADKGELDQLLAAA